MIVSKYLKMLFELLEQEGDYRELVIALIMFERGLEYSDAQIVYYEWYESSEGSFLNDILAGEEDGE